MSRTFDIVCNVEVENTFDSLHAHAFPEGVEIRPGDSVLLHDAAIDVALGERLTYPCRATVTRAGWLERQFTPIFAMLELGDLFNVGFEPMEALVLVPRGAARGASAQGAAA